MLCIPTRCAFQAALIRIGLVEMIRFCKKFYTGISVGVALSCPFFSAPSLPLLCPFSAPSLPLLCPFSAPSLPLLCPFSAPSLPLLFPPPLYALMCSLVG